MLRTLRQVSMTDVAYVLLLLVFVALGTFVYALATERALAGIIGGSLVVLMVASIVGFRIGARKRARSNDSGMVAAGNPWILRMAGEPRTAGLATACPRVR